MNLHTFITMGAAAAALAFAGFAYTSQPAMNNKAIVKRLYEEGFAKGDGNVLRELIAESYKQHNPGMEDGLQGLLNGISYMKAHPEAAFSAQPVRYVAEGNLVAVHSNYDWQGKKAVVDLFRLENGKIVEHWDAVQAQPEHTASGHTMTDGATQLQDLGKTAANKTLVNNFMNDILLQGKMDKLAQYFDGDHYIQHNPGVGDGLSGLGKAMQEMAKQGIHMEYQRVHRTVAEGNFVLTQSEGNFAGKHVAYYDLFRIENGKIAEHWDVIQPVPAEAKNSNGMF